MSKGKSDIIELEWFKFQAFYYFRTSKDIQI